MDARIEQDAWLKAAIGYASRWLDFKMGQFAQPGCAVAVTHRARDANGEVMRIQIGGAGFVSEEMAKAQMQKRYGVRVAAD
ncbi:MAG: hypothetical protein ACOY4O_01890 [Pseudomonadota bacterium]